MKMIEIFLALAVAMLAGCAQVETVTTAAPRPRTREGVVATAVVSDSQGDAERLLASALASAVGATDLGHAASGRAARTAARATGADYVLICRIQKYDPYDPQRLVLDLALLDVASGRLSAADVMALGWTAALPPEARAREKTLWSARAEIDAGSDEMLRTFALERGFIGTRKDIVEASILIRDPARFFPFAARLVASRVPVRATRPTTARALGQRP